MKTLLLIRHAKSSWEDAGMTDFDRPLNARGMKDADAMARRLLQRISLIDAFISSPALRAKTTAQHFAAAFQAPKNHLHLQPDLYLAPSACFASLINTIDNQLNSIAIFAHNPGITDYANSLTTVVRTDNIPTCGIFAVTAEVDSWKDFAAASRTFFFYDYPKLHG